MRELTKALLLILKLSVFARLFCFSVSGPIFRMNFFFDLFPAGRPGDMQAERDAKLNGWRMLTEPATSH